MAHLKAAKAVQLKFARFQAKKNVSASARNGINIRRNANRNLSLILMIIVALSPIPFGSNRPAFWAISAFAIALTGLIYVLSFQISGIRNLRFPLANIKIPAFLFALLIGFLIIQIVPFGSMTIARSAEVELISRSLSIDPGGTILMLVRQLSYGLFFFLVLQVGVNRQRARKMLLGLFLITLAYAIFGMVALTQLGDISLFGKKIFFLGNATGTFTNRNSFATFLAMGGIAGLSLVLCDMTQVNDKRSRTQKGFALEKNTQIVVYMFALVVIGATILSTQSRMGAFSAVGGMIIVSILVTVNATTKNAKFVGIAFLTGFSVLTVLSILFGAGLLERLGSVEQSFGVRGDLYAQVIDMIKTRPLAGFGGGSFNLAFPLFHNFPVSTDLIWNKAHSTYLTLWSELGLVFGSILIIILGYFLLQLIMLARVSAKRFVNSIAAIGACVVIGLHSLMDFSLEIQANTYMFLAILGLGIAGFAERKSNAPEDNTDATR